MENKKTFKKKNGEKALKTEKMQKNYALKALWGYRIKGPTKAWSDITVRCDIAEQFDLFHQGNIFGEEEDCLLEFLKSGKRFKKIRNRPLSLEE